MILAERRKTPSTEFCLFCEKRHSACSQCCSRNAVVSIPVAAAGGWAEMMYVWRETADNPLLPPSLSPSLPSQTPLLQGCSWEFVLHLMCRIETLLRVCYSVNRDFWDIPCHAYNACPAGWWRQMFIKKCLRSWDARQCDSGARSWFRDWSPSKLMAFKIRVNVAFNDMSGRITTQNCREDRLILLSQSRSHTHPTQDTVFISQSQILFAVGRFQWHTEI